MKRGLLRWLAQRYLVRRFVRDQKAHLDHDSPMPAARNGSWRDDRWQSILNEREALPKHGEAS